MVLRLPSFLHWSASSMTPRTACAASGAGRMPSARANCTAALKVAICGTARASITPSS